MWSVFMYNCIVANPCCFDEWCVYDRTLWNFSPKGFFTDSSGMYWRERRLASGVYTDGDQVYETSYRYSDGRNGIRKVDSLGSFLNNTQIDESTKQNVHKALAKKFPDLMIEG